MGLFLHSYQSVCWQHVKELAGDIPTTHIVPECALKIVASIQIYWIKVFLFSLKTFNRVNHSAITADTGRAAGIARLAIDIGGFVSKKTNNEHILPFTSIHG